MASVREHWLSYYWAVSGDREDCAYTSWTHLNPLNPDQEYLQGRSRSKLATWRLGRMMKN